MNKIVARVPASAGLSIFLLIYLSVAPYTLAVPEPGHNTHATRQELIGAWRLVSIQIVGPGGPMNDPFYNADPTGILIYDQSGWMSVQIAGKSRPSMEAPAFRPARSRTAEVAQLEAAVLDSYYAYAATWEYDETASTVTHHIKTSLIPGEDGMSYSQTVTLDGGNLIFTVRRAAPGGATVQRKVWQRISSLTD
jgi:Lipocalin-like domain